MASKKKESEGIALLSIYGDDEDDDMEEAAAPETDNPPRETVNNMEDDSEAIINCDRIPNWESDVNIDSSNTPPSKNSTPKLFSSSTLQPVAMDSVRSRTERPTIVDYGHDEAALSPDAEDGEIIGVGRVMFGAGLHMSRGEVLEQTSQGTPPQPSEQVEAMEYTVTKSLEVEETVRISLDEPKDVDPLDKFLPPPPKVKCSDELQEKIIKFLSLKKTTGRSFNAEVRNRKDYRNPDFLLHAVTYQDIDQIGTCFSKDVFDPHGYNKSDYYDEIEADMKREMEQERKKSQKIEYISGGTQLGTVVPSPKVHLPIPGVSSGTGGGLLPVPPSVDAVPRDSRPNKKSKWDKVDGDRRNPLGAQDSVSAAGTGYTAFAQQRRREAEEKRSSDKKFERRS